MFSSLKKEIESCVYMQCNNNQQKFARKTKNEEKRNETAAVAIVNDKNILSFSLTLSLITSTFTCCSNPISSDELERYKPDVLSFLV